MKNLLFYLLFFLFSIHFQSVNAQDYRAINAFFRSEDYYPARTILQLFNPEGEFIRYQLMDSSRIIEQQGEETVFRDSCRAQICLGCDNTIVEVELMYSYSPSTFFYQVSVWGDGVKPISGAELKSFVNKMKTDFKKGEIAWIEKKMGKSIDEMDATEICRAFINIKYWKTDIKRLY